MIPSINSEGFSPITYLQVSLCASYEMISAVTGEIEFITSDHIWRVKEERRDKQKVGILGLTQTSWELFSTKAPYRNAFSVRQSHRILAVIK